MSKCYLEDAIRTHTDVGPFERCTVCGKTICSECIGRHLPSGARLVRAMRIGFTRVRPPRPVHVSPGESGIHHLSTAQKSSFHKTRDASAV